MSAAARTHDHENTDTEPSSRRTAGCRMGDLLGRSPIMRRLFSLATRLAAIETTLLIDGETGTGKSVLAEAIHHQSPRASKPWIVVDCSSIPPTLVESVLFGHERGAFSGAVAARPGAFEAADGGTVLLDEIGELPADVQPKLLRLLETKTVTRIGRNEPVALDIRIIAATHRDLRGMVGDGSFRSDLFYRLNVVRLRIPPLRDRREDIELLGRRFFTELAGRPPTEVQLAALVSRDWPGNIRELRNAVESMALRADLGDVTGVADLDDVDDRRPTDGDGGASEFEARSSFDTTVPFRDAKERMTASWERWYLRRLIARSAGNLSRAAREAQMDRRYLRDLLRQHGVR